jgi:hypothetical protein
MVLVAPAARLRGLSSCRNAELVLRSLAAGTAPDELYLYYGPEPGQRLEQSTAVQTFSQLRRSGRGPKQLPFGASPLVLGLVTAALVVAVLCQFRTASSPVAANAVNRSRVAPQWSEDSPMGDAEPAPVAGNANAELADRRGSKWQAEWNARGH